MYHSNSQVCSDIPFLDGPYPIREDRVISAIPHGDIEFDSDRDTIKFEKFTISVSAENPRILTRLLFEFKMPEKRTFKIDYDELHRTAIDVVTAAGDHDIANVKDIALILALHDVLIRNRYALSIVDHEQSPHFALMKRIEPVLFHPLKPLECRWLIRA